MEDLYSELYEEEVVSRLLLFVLKKKQANLRDILRFYEIYLKCDKNESMAYYVVFKFKVLDEKE